MNEITCYDYNNERIFYFNQWDLNQIVYIDKNIFPSEAIVSFQFCDDTCLETYDVKTKYNDDKIGAMIPNILLQGDKAITMYVYVTQSITSYKSKTKYTTIFPIKKRIKPSNYIFVDNIEQLSNMIDDLSERIIVNKNEIQHLDESKLETSLKGSPDGLAELDSNGILVLSQLPLGETSSVAYRGDRGKIAYDHSQSPHARVDATNTTYTQTLSSGTKVGSISVNGKSTDIYCHSIQDNLTSTSIDDSLSANQGKILKELVDTHKNNTDNPHGVTKAQVGLGNVPNVSTNEQVVTFSEPNTRNNIVNGDKLNIIIGKVFKFFKDLKNVAFTGSYNDLTDKPIKSSYNENNDDALFEIGNGNENALSNAFEVKNDGTVIAQKDFVIKGAGSVTSFLTTVTYDSKNKQIIIN